MESRRKPRTRRVALTFGTALFAAVLANVVAPVVARAGDDKAPPSGGPPPDSPHSRLTLSGAYRVDTSAQKNFLLGSSLDATDARSDFDAFWTQELWLTPRLIVSDNVNVTLRTTLAQGIWGIDASPSGGTGWAGSTSGKDSFFAFHVDWAYLSYRHVGSNTRWYVGRQPFTLGNRIVLDEISDGIQFYKDLPGLASTLAFGFAKESEGADALTDQNTIPRGTGGTIDGRDADLMSAEWKLEKADGSFRLNPYYAWYLDRGNADGATMLPDGLGYLEARFRPQISKATVMGAALRLRRGALKLDGEFDTLSGQDRVANLDSGPFELHDVNNGDLTGSNLYARLALIGSRIEIGGTFAQGSGDPDVASGEGNINALRSNGHFGLTEVWEDGIAPDQEGIAPAGLGSPIARGYRGLENTRYMQGHLALHFRKSMELGGSFTLIRASEALRGFADGNSDGRITSDEFTGAPSTELGSELDAHLDWSMDRNIRCSLRGGLFFPRIGAGYLINGTGRYQEKAQEIRFVLSVPIPEFSLGG